MSLSTHVLDIARGQPAAGIPVELRREGELLVSTDTDADGRASFGEVRTGTYELEFAVGDHFGQAGGAPPVPGPDPDPLHDHRSCRPLPRAAARVALGVQHVPRQLARLSRPRNRTLTTPSQDRLPVQ